MGPLFTLVNRTSKALSGLWNGKTYVIPPGKSAYPQIMAEKFKQQNPLMGSMNDKTGECRYLIGIEENMDDCTPLEQSDAVELLDRETLGPGAQDVKIYKGGIRAEERHTAVNPDLTFGK